MLMYCQELRRCGEPQRRLLDGGGHVPQAGAPQGGGQDVRVVYGEHGAHEPAEVGADVLDEGAFEDLEWRLDRARCADCHPATGDERAAHLGDGRRSVGHEHEAHLAEHGVVGVVGERQGGRVPDVPVDGGLGRCRRGAGDGDHVWSEIDTCDQARRSDGFGREPGDDAGAAGDVEDALAGP